MPASLDSTSFFKKYYSDLAGPEFTAKYKTLIYLAGSASAEVIADVALCPFEAVKVRVQTQPGFARGLADGMPNIKSEGALGALGEMVVVVVQDCWKSKQKMLDILKRFHSEDEQQADDMDEDMCGNFLSFFFFLIHGCWHLEERIAFLDSMWYGYYVK